MIIYPLRRDLQRHMVTDIGSFIHNGHIFIIISDGHMPVIFHILRELNTARATSFNVMKICVVQNGIYIRFDGGNIYFKRIIDNSGDAVFKYPSITVIFHFKIKLKISGDPLRVFLILQEFRHRAGDLNLGIPCENGV